MLVTKKSIKEQLETFGNPSTGSVFYTVAKGHGIKVGVRFWVDVPSNPKNKTEVGCRFRFQSESDSVVHTSFKDFVSGIFGALPFTGGSNKHASIAFSSTVNCPVWEKDKVYSILESNKASEVLYSRALKMFLGKMEGCITQDQFHHFFMNEVSDLLAEFSSANSKYHPDVVVDFSGAKVLLKGGVDVTPPMDVDLASTSMITDGPGYAPPPSDTQGL